MDDYQFDSVKPIEKGKNLPRWDIITKSIQILELPKSYSEKEHQKKMTNLMRKIMYGGDYNCFCKIEKLMSQGCDCGGK